MSNESPLVSIIIVNLNGRQLLEECLKSLHEIDYNNFEIILVDNNSSDGSVDFVKENYPSIKLLTLEKNYGFSYPNNIGAKQAKGNYLLFLNNDTKVTSSFLSELVKYMQKNSDVGICQSLLLKPTGDIDSSGDFVDSYGICYSSKKSITKVTDILSAKGAALLIRTEIFQKLNGFDEKFFITFEDVDLGWRTWIIGFRVVIIPTSVVYHIGSSTIKKIDPGISFHGFKNQICMKLTNFEIILSIKALIFFFFTYGSRWLRVYFDYKIKGHTNLTATKYEDTIAKEPNFGAVMKSLGWLIKNTGYVLQKRRWLSKNRIFTSKELTQKKVIT